MSASQVAAFRRFNRLVTQRIGALDDHFLGRDRPLGESRVLYEIGQTGADLRELRARLGLDSGYLSRVIQSLTRAGLIAVGEDDDDGRVRHARWTRAGRAEVREMNRRSDQAAERTLAALTPAQRERLVNAMADVHGLLRVAALEIEPVDPASPAARRCIAHYFDELARRFEHGFDPGQSLQASDADLRPPQGIFLVAHVEGEAVACGALKRIAPGVGSIKRMWVDGSLRGLGIGRRMLTALEAQARRMKMKTLRLETNRSLAEAIRLYETAGYARVAAFNDDPYADHWFEKRLQKR